MQEWLSKYREVQFLVIYLFMFSLFVLRTFIPPSASMRIDQPQAFSSHRPDRHSKLFEQTFNDISGLVIKSCEVRSLRIRRRKAGKTLIFNVAGYK
jgi:hypothetical protein